LAYTLQEVAAAAAYAGTPAEAWLLYFLCDCGTCTCALVRVHVMCACLLFGYG